jgi:uncharacterized membrane protein YbaN (DUF454 family)
MTSNDKQKADEHFDQKNLVKSKLGRKLLIAAGSFFVVIGLIGIFLPVLPTTPFLLLAAWCYARSSERYYKWLITNKWFGEYIRNYQEGKGIPLKIKVFAILFLWVTILISVYFFITNIYVRIILIVIASVVTIHIITFPTIKKKKSGPDSRI